MNPGQATQDAAAEAPTMQGQCLCGAVTLTIKRNPDVEICHCGMCRRWGGGPLMSISCGTDVEINGAENMAVYASSEWAERTFCKTCGTHLFYRLKEFGTMSVTAGLFQDQVEFQLTEQIYIDKKPAFYDFANQTHTLTEAEVIAKFFPT